MDRSAASDDLGPVLERLLELTGTRRDAARVREAAWSAEDGEGPAAGGGREGPDASAAGAARDQPTRDQPAPEPAAPEHPAAERAAGAEPSGAREDASSDGLAPPAREVVPDRWSARIVRALEALGLRAAPVLGVAAELGARVGRGQPFVVRGRLGGAPERTLVVSERRGGRVRVEDPASREARWVAISQLATVVRSDPGPWIAVDAAMPLETIGPAAARHGHDHPTPRERLAAWVRLERGDLGAIVIYAAGIGVLGLTTPVAVQSLVSTVAFGTVLQPVLVLSVLLFGALALSAVLRALQAWLVEILQRRLFVRVVADLAHRLPRVRRDALDRAHAPELVNRFFDVFTVQKTAAALLLGGLEIALTVAVGLVVLAFYHPYLLALDVLLVAAVLLAALARARRGTETAIDESRAKYAMAAWLEELAGHHGELKLAGGPRWASERADDLARAYLHARGLHFRVAFQQLVSMLAIQAVASAAVLGIGGWLVIARQLTLGQLVAAELVVTAVVASLAKVGKYLENGYDLLAGLHKLGHLADLPVEREDGAAGELAPTAALRLERVRAGYLGTEILSGVDLEVEAGERLVVTGPSGGGKSLLVEVIASIREPSGGRVLVDGRDVRDLSLATLRRRIAAVSRTATVAGSVLENVRLGRPEIDASRARAALGAVGLVDEVDALEQGIHTELLPDGAPLGDGHALRLTIARAIAGEPSLLVIDHVLDGIDDAAREPLLDALFDRDAPWTLVVASADPDVLARADRVLVLRDGALRPRALDPGAGPPGIGPGRSAPAAIERRSGERRAGDRRGAGPGVLPPRGAR